MSPAQYLIDTSALSRLFRQKKEMFSPWYRALDNGIVAVSPVTELELLYGARSSEDRASLVDRLNRLLLPSPFDDRHISRAWEVQRVLTAHGEHRSAGPVDLLVAAAAEVNDLTLLHYDRDFDTIARCTGQPTQWLAAPGSA